MTRVRTPDAARPVTVRPARTDEHDAVAQLLLDAYSASFWTTAHFDALLADVAGAVERQDLWVAVDGDPGGGSGPEGAGAGTGHGAAPAGRILGAVYVERETRPGPDGALELEYNRLGVAPAARHTETDSAAPEARAALDAQTH